MIGEYGPLVLVLLSWYLLLFNKLLIVYTLGLVLNSIFNLILKELIKHPRPVRTKMSISSDNYGMPSGHAQMSFYSTAFIYFALKNMYITLFYLVYSLYICYQRIHTSRHFLLQVVVGAIIGFIVGWLFYKIRNNI